MTSTGFFLTGESANSSTKRTELQIRRTMKMMGMSVSFMSAMEKKEDRGLLARMGRYSDRAACCSKQSTHMQQRNKHMNPNTQKWMMSPRKGLMGANVKGLHLYCHVIILVHATEAGV